MRVLAYRDTVRMRHRDDAEALAGYDVVLCTYGCLVHDSPLKGAPRGEDKGAPRRTYRGIFRCAQGLGVWDQGRALCLACRAYLDLNDRPRARRAALSSAHRAWGFGTRVARSAWPVALTWTLMHQMQAATRQAAPVWARMHQGAAHTGAACRGGRLQGWPGGALGWT